MELWQREGFESFRAWRLAKEKARKAANKAAAATAAATAAAAMTTTHGRELFFSDLEQGDFLAESDCI